MKILTASHSCKPSLTGDQVSRGFELWDITIKSGCESGWWLAPTWSMVNGIKGGYLSEKDFTSMYYRLITRRFNQMRWAVSAFPSHLILVCYCGADVFCHRYLAAEFLQKNLGATYYGEYRTP